MFRKYPSLQLFRKSLFLSSISFFFIRKFLFEKISFEKNVFLSKSQSKKLFFEQETSIISSWLLLHFLKKKRFAIFQLSFYFCVCCVFLFFLLSVLFSSVFHPFWVFFKQKITFEKKLSRNISFLKLCFIWTFFWEERSHLEDQKLSLEFFSKKKRPFEEKETYFKIHTRWGSRARLNALFDHWWRDVTWLGESSLMCIRLSLILSFFDFSSIFHYFLCFLLFFIFCVSPFFGWFFYSVSLCFRCLHLFMYLLQILFLLCFWFLCHFLIFSVGWCLLFFSFFWIFSFLFLFFLFLFFVCVVLFSLSLTLSDKITNLLSLCSLCSKRFNPFCQVFFFWMPFQTQYFLFACICNFVRWISSPCFFLFGERWGKGSKNTSWSMLLILSLPLSQSIILFHLFHYLFLFPFFFTYFDVLFIPKTKSIEIVFLFVFLTIFEKNNSPKMFSHISLH